MPKLSIWWVLTQILPYPKFQILLPGITLLKILHNGSPTHSSEGVKGYDPFCSGSRMTRWPQHIIAIKQISCSTLYQTFTHWLTEKCLWVNGAVEWQTPVTKKPQDKCTHMHACTHVYAHTHMHACTHTCTHTHKEARKQQQNEAVWQNMALVKMICIFFVTRTQTLECSDSRM